MWRPEARAASCARLARASRRQRSLAATVARAEPAPYRYQAPIAIDAPAPFVQMALPPAAYAHVEQDELRDLRIVDAGGVFGRRIRFSGTRGAWLGAKKICETLIPLRLAGQLECPEHALELRQTFGHVISGIQSKYARNGSMHFAKKTSRCADRRR